MKKLLENTAYYTLLGLWYLCSSLPLCVHYMVSDVLCLLLYYVVRYRRKVTRDNLMRCFPDMKPRQLRLTELRFYRHFCDLFFESFKHMTISTAQMRRRMRVTNPEVINREVAKGRSCAFFLGHYANWEWFSSMPLWTDAVCMQLYHPLENKVFDRLIARTRSQWGGYNVPMEQSLRAMLRHRQEGKPFIVGFIADQTPRYVNIHYWTKFFGQDTAYFTGAERLCRQLDLSVFYIDIRRCKRGYYEATIVPMCEHPKQTPEFGVTELYNQHLQRTIQNNPPYWLWSHSRWKRTFPLWLEEMEEIRQTDRISHLEEGRETLRQAGIID